MRTATIKENKKMFTLEEYLTKSQIHSLFSRMSVLQKSGKLKPPAVMEIEEMIDEEDLSDEVYNCCTTLLLYNISIVYLFLKFLFQNSGIEMAHEIQTIIEDIRNEERTPVQIGSYVAPVNKESRKWYIGM